VKFFHLISSEATLVIDDVAMYVTGTGTPSETNVPIVEFVSPKAGDVLSGVVTLTASSTDDTAVAGVYFAVNGNPEGPEDTTSPYQTNWDTTLVPDGQYVLKATTHDVYGNNDKVEILVTVDNSNATTTPPNGTTTNLILNPDFEINGTGGNPANWKKGGWGTNNRVLTYPTAGQTGQGAKVAITSFTNGDAKWYFDEVDVEPNKEYTIGDSYKSNISSEALLRYTLVGGGTQYFFLEDLPSSNNAWTTFSKKFTTPANVESVTLFHTIAGVGEMTVDNYLLTDGTIATTTPDTTDPVVAVTTPNEGSTINGTVNVTVNATDNIAVAGVQLMIDGALFGNVDTTAPYTFVLDTTALSNGAHTIGARATDTAANTKDAVLVNVVVENSTTTPPTGNNLIINGDFETDDGTGNPANWKKGGWGTNNRNFSYISEIGGSHAFVSITGYVGGDAKWYFDDVSVLPNTEYTISDEYNSNIPSEALLRYTLTGGTTQYVFLESLPATGGTWNTFSKKFTTPANVESVTMFHIISA
ncbi:hypothetical protein KC845_04200, partial [Candidatus Kaiserbacteria bacterium]|nr:hypothetical protein [Candidatus Kaiserbacteria bacterium]